jgi:hypothetical protein
VNIETGSLYFLVLNHKIFGGKQFGKLGLDFVIDWHWFDSYEIIIQKKRVVKPSSVPV